MEVERKYDGVGVVLQLWVEVGFVLSVVLLEEYSGEIGFVLEVAGKFGFVPGTA